jgi:hypothetical protein
MQDDYLTEMARQALVKLARIERIASRRFERILTADGAIGQNGPPGFVADTVDELSWRGAVWRGSRRAKG